MVIWRTNISHDNSGTGISVSTRVSRRGRRASFFVSVGNGVVVVSFVVELDDESVVAVVVEIIVVEVIVVVVVVVVGVSE